MQYLTLKEVVKNYPYLNKLILKCPDGSIATFHTLHCLPEFVYRIPYEKVTEDYEALICYVAPLRVVDIIQICPYPGLQFLLSDGAKQWQPTPNDIEKYVVGVRKINNCIVLFLKGELI